MTVFLLFMAYALSLTAALASEHGPSFDCSGVEAGSNESFWEHHGEATLTWGYDGPELHCTAVEAGG
jgi:hypothetical protein